MILEDVIEALERNVREVNDNATFIVQKYSVPCRLASFTKFTYILWYIDTLRNKEFPIIRLINTSRVTSEEERNKEVREIEIQFITSIFRYIMGEKFKLILGGSYDGDESISNLDN